MRAQVFTVIPCHKESRKCYACPQTFIFRDTRHRGAKYRMMKPWVSRRYTYDACTSERQETDAVFRKSEVWIQLLVIVNKYFEHPRVGIVPVLV